MKVTTQQTSKPAKLLLLLGRLGVVVGIVSLLMGLRWAMLPLFGGALIWGLGGLLAWWFNE